MSICVLQHPAPMPNQAIWQPLAQVAVRDKTHRAAISAALRDSGWAVVDSPSGYHLLQTIAGAITDDQLWCRPRMIVVDAFSPGCSGVTIARGIRNLGWSIPVVLIVYSEEHKQCLGDVAEESVYVVDSDRALSSIVELARHTINRPTQEATYPS